MASTTTLGRIRRSQAVAAVAAMVAALCAVTEPAMAAATFIAASDVLVAPAPGSVAAADFNGEAKADMAVGSHGSNLVSVRLGDGLGGFTPAPDLVVGFAPISVAVGDFNGDGRADVAAASFNEHTVAVRLGNADGTFAVGPVLAVGGEPALGGGRPLRRQRVRRPGRGQPAIAHGLGAPRGRRRELQRRA